MNQASVTKPVLQTEDISAGGRSRAQFSPGVTAAMLLAGIECLDCHTLRAQVAQPLDEENSRVPEGLYGSSVSGFAAKKVEIFYDKNSWSQITTLDLTAQRKRGYITALARIPVENPRHALRI